MELDFGTIAYKKWESADCLVKSVLGVRPKEFSKYVQDLSGTFICQERHNLGTSSFYAFARRDQALFLSYYPEIGQMRIVQENKSGYFDLRDRIGGWQLPTLMSQIDLTERGMAYVIRLSDGRFVILDGGRNSEENADKLMTRLKAQSPERYPVIAGWFLTSEKEDHRGCFHEFQKKYGESVVLQAVFANFTADADAEVKASCKDGRTVLVRPHTGQAYQMGNAWTEVLASPDDVKRNGLDLILRMKIEGQTILFCSDCDLREATVAERYGDYLKSDLLQVPNHGREGGNSIVYGMISPKVCLVPAGEQEYYGYDGFFREENQTLLYGLDVQEILTGSNGDKIIDMPYKAKPNGRVLLLEKAKTWQKKLGGSSWFFAELSPVDDKFTVLNSTGFAVEIKVTRYFADREAEAFLVEVPANAVKQIELEGMPCAAVHFLADRPVVIWGTKEPVYVH